MRQEHDLIMVSTGDIDSIPGMLLINQSGVDWLKGRLDTGTYFDVLEQFGIDPIAFIKPVEEFAYYQIPSLELL